MKKLIGIPLTLIVLSSLFIGCGGSKSATTTTQSQPTTSAAVTTSAPATSSKPATTSASPTTSVTSTPPSTTQSTIPATSSATTTTTTPPTTSAAPTTSASGNDLSALLAKAQANFYVEIKITAPEGTQNMKEWIKGGNPSKFRMEITAATGSSVIIFDGTYNYFYDPVSKMAYKMSAAMASSYSSSSSNSSSINTYTPVYDGSETVNGVDCSIYKYTNAGVVTRMWISKANGMTIRVVSGTSQMDYTNYSFAFIPDSTFQLPADAQLITIPGQ